ncbi:MAG: class I SAM-dependent methyltransferase [Planctomycetes bacterium]|nr:class I SAM-dependent methyltransferase [Planctomycetota bacterium]
MERLRAKYADPRIVARYDLRYADLEGRRSNARVLRAVHRALEPLPAGARVLDLPCGTGRLFELLVGRGWRPCGVDLSRDMLRAVPERSRAPRGVRVPRVAADVRALPFRDASFEAAICLRFLQLLEPEERIEVLRALARVTRGPLVAVYSPHHTWKDATRALRRWLGVRRKDREGWIPWAVIDAEIAAAELVCTRRVHACRGFVDAVALRLERAPAR